MRNKLSLAMSHLGVPRDPKQLNSQLAAIQGFTTRGQLKWHSVSALTKGKISFLIPKAPTHDLIDQSIKAGNPVVTKILLWESVPHWVLIVGKDQNDYLVKNPLNSDRSLQKLSELSKCIHSIRIAKTVEPESEPDF